MAQTIGRAYVDVLPSGRSLTNFQRQVERSVGSIKLNVDQSRGAFAPLGKISADLNQFQNSLDASVARTLAFGASVGVIGGTVRSIRAVIQSFIEVEKSIADINAVFKLTAPELKGFTSGLFDVARSTAQSFKDVASAATEFSRQGLSVSETLKRTESAMKLVRLAGLETTQAVNVLTAAMNGFSSAGLESQEIVNKLATVDAAYAVSSADLALALSRAGDTAQGAKVSFDELLAAVTAVQQRTARGGAVIGNGLKSIFTRLQRSKVQSSLEDVGVATKDADGNIRESMSILEDYAAVYNTLSDSQRAFTDEQIAGVYQINTLKALVKDLTNEYGVYNGAVRTSTEATDEAEKRMAALSQTTDAKLKRMSASFQEFASIGGEKLFKPLLDTLTKYPSIVIDSLNSAMKAEKRGFGGDLFAGLFEGVGKFLQGPGLIMGIKTVIKLVGFLGSEAIKAAQQVSAIGSQTQKRVQLEQQVLGLLQTDSNLMAQIAAGTINAANGHRLIEASLTRQIQLSERVAAVQKMVGAYVGTNPAVIAGHAAMFGAKPRRMADGYAPALKKERRSISQGVGGARGGDKPVVIPDFNYGGGKRGPAVAHTGEWFVPHFNGGNAIFNRDMAESYGLPSGAVRVGMAGGHIPSFAGIRQQMLPGFTNAGKSASTSGSSGFHSGLNIGEINEAVASISRPKELRKFLNSLGLRGSKGSSRAWYGLGGGRGVKVPFNEAGMAQSEVENRILFEDYFAAQSYAGILPKGYVVNHESGAAILESLGPARANDFKRLTGLNKSRFLSGRHGGQYGRFGSYEYSGKPKRGSENDFVAEVDDFLANYGLLGADFVGGRNIGLSADDKLKLLDIGYSDDVKRRFYTNRNLGRNVAEGHIPNFVDFRSSRPFRGDSKQLRIQYRLGDKVPAGQDPRVDMLRDDPYIGRIDKTFKTLGLPEPKASIRDFLLDYDSAGKLNSSTGGGVYYPGTGESVIARQGSKASDFLGIVGHEIGGHHLDWSFKDSKRGKSLGVEGPISDDPRFVSKFNRAYKSWQKHGPNAKISPILKHTFSRVEDTPNFYPTNKSVRREVFADMAQFLYGRKSGPKAKRTAIGGLMSSITGAGTFASGYDPLSQAISRESDAVGSGKVRIGTHPSLKAPHNPMGIGVYNSTEGSLSNGIRMARAAGIEPKTKGMAEGHVPHFAVDEGGSYFTNRARHRMARQESQPIASAVESVRERTSNLSRKIPLDSRLDDALATFRMRLEEAGDDMKKRNLAEKDYAKTLKRIQGDAEKRMASAPKAGSATNKYEAAQLGVRADATRATKRVDKLLQGLERREFDAFGRSESPQSGMIPMRARSMDDPTPPKRGVRVSAPLREFYSTTESPPARSGARDRLKKAYNRAFSYTEEEQKKGKGQGRFGFAFGAQIGGGIARNVTQGTTLEKGVGAFADGLDIAATALTLIPGPAGKVAAIAAGLGTALYGLFKDTESDKFQAALEKNALAANRSAQALADATQSYTAYEAAMQSRDPARMMTALNKLTEKIFKIGEFDPTAMRGALGAIASSNPMEGFADAQAAVAKRQTSIDNTKNVYEAAKKEAERYWSSSGMSEEGSMTAPLINFKEGVTNKQANAALDTFWNKKNSGDIDGAFSELAKVIDGGTETIKAMLEGGYGGDLGGVTTLDKKTASSELFSILSRKVPSAGGEKFVAALKGPMAEVARTQKEAAFAAKSFGFEVAKAAANIQIFSANASRGFEAASNFRDKQFSSSLDTLQSGDRLTEREALNLGAKEDVRRITATRDFSRNSLGAEARAQGLELGQKLVEGGGTGKEKGAAAINDLFTRADKFAQAGDTEGLKGVFSKESINALGLGGENNEDIINSIQKSGTDMIAKLAALEADSKTNLSYSAKQNELQSKILDANTYMKSIWGKGGTQKGANEITEAIRRIEMARSKGDLTISEREQLAADLGTVKSESGVDYDEKLRKFNQNSLNAAIVENVANGNTNYIGAQKTASTQTQVDEQVNLIRARSGDGSATSSPMADYTRRLVEVNDKGEAAFEGLGKGLGEAPDLADVNASFQAVRTESDKLAAAFATLAGKFDAAEEAKITENLTKKDFVRKDTADATKRDKAKRKLEDEKKISELLREIDALDPKNRMKSVARPDLNEKRKQKQADLDKIREEQKKGEKEESTPNSKMFLEAMQRIADKITDPTSKGGATYSEAEIKGALRVELSTNTLTVDLAKAIEETLQGKSNAIAKDAIAFAFKGFARK